MPDVVETPLSSVAFCWRVERRDGAGLALTSHDEPLSLGGEVYQAAPGIVPAATVRELGLEPHSGEVSGALSSDALTEDDLGLGCWDGARVTLLAVDWQEPDAGSIQLLGGEIGEVELKDGSFAAELRGAAERLNEPVCPATSPECRATFGDKRCRVDLAGRTIRAAVAGGSGTELQLDKAADERFVLGRLHYLSGGNCGLSTTIVSVTGTTVRVRDVPRAAVEQGCRVELREGCDKRLETCVARFDNAANFRGEPHLPGNDLLTRYPGS